MQVEKLSITLPPELAQMVRDKVGSGSYASNSEVIREALRLLQEQEEVKARKLEWLRDKVARSFADDRPLLDDDEVGAILDQRAGNS